MNDERKDQIKGAPRNRVRLPRFVVDEDVGLGDLVKKATYAVGITPCTGCERRTAVMNRWITFGSGNWGKRG